MEKLNALIENQEYELDKLQQALAEIKGTMETLDGNATSHVGKPLSQTKRPNILLIEDDELAILAVNNCLRDLDCEVSKAMTVADALAALNQQSFDIVLCDLNLPDGDGLDIIDAVKKDALGPNYRTPFIALTADSNKGRTLVAEQHGFDLYLVKPLTKESAKAVIDVYAFNLATDIRGDVNTMDSQAVIDLDQAEAIIGCDKQAALELIGRLVQDFPEEQAELVEAYQHNDLTTVRHILHRLKGGASYCGVPQLKAAINFLHDQVKDEVELSDLEPAFLRVYRELDAVKRVYESLSHSVH